MCYRLMVSQWYASSESSRKEKLENRKEKLENREMEISLALVQTANIFSSQIRKRFVCSVRVRVPTAVTGTSQTWIDGLGVGGWGAF